MEKDILEYAAKMDCPELHLFVDEPSSLKAIVAIHSTTLGPALGGCRCIEYPSTTAGIIDAIRLAQGMTYKAAISNLPLGGGKMVILKPKEIPNRKLFFQAVGRAVDSLGGRYITAVDSGTSVEDMDIVATITEHVTSTSKSVFSKADPSYLTAEGVLRGIEAAVKFKLGKKTLAGLHVGIQGLGHAGYALAKLLHQAGAKLSLFDINPQVLKRCEEEFSAKSLNNLEALLEEPMDVFAPSALGGIINDNTIAKIKAPIVAGCANNQLEEARHGLMLMEKDILYAPDYVINAGGLIYVAAQFSHITEEVAKRNINAIYDTLTQIFMRAKNESKPTNEVADELAKEKLHGSLGIVYPEPQTQE